MNKKNADVLLFGLLIRLWGHLSQRRKFQFILLGILMPIGGVAEIVSLGAVMPFLGALISPEKIFSHPAMAFFVSALKIKSGEELVLPVLIIFVMLAVISAILRVILLSLMTQLAYASGSDLSNQVYRRTLYQPYSVHISRHSSKVISGIINKVGGCVNVLQQVLILINMAIIVIFVSISLFLVDPVIAAISILGFGTSYGVLTLICRMSLTKKSRRISQELENLHKSLQEGLGAIREVLLNGTQELYCEIYRRADQPLRRAQSGVTLIAGIPRFAMEALGITLIAVLAYKFSIQPGGLTVAIPVLGAMALSAQRLLPALQQAYHAYATIVATQKSLSDAIELLDQKTDVPHSIDKVKSMDFTRALELVNISFAYVEGEGLIINNLNIKIEKGTRIGIIGTTGSGKSTLMDIIMGLLEPSSGSILVDGTPVQGALVNQWQKNIAHVSQSVYLRDATLAENIAFGVHEVDIDIDRVKFAAKKAHIADYIEGLTYGYNTMVGERGVRFSGGQRQRIAIARALYRSASVLVLDEATSALDEDTESSVIEAIESLDRDLTILIISHKTQTLKKCDRVIKLENGCIVKDGSFIEVVGV